MLSANLRLRARADFNKCYSKGSTGRGKYITVKSTPNNKSHIRLGVVVSKKVSKSAVARNRIRRRISAIVRENIDNKMPVDIVIIANNQSLEASFTDLNNDINKAYVFATRKR